jgi:hypothetical protein
MAVLVGAAPGEAGAQEDFERSIDTVRQLLESRQYEKALEQLSRLKPQARDEKQRSRVAVYEGLVLSNMGRQAQERAQAAFKAALELDPQASLPVKMPPRQERAFEDVRTRVLKEQAERPVSSRDDSMPPAAEGVPEASAPPEVAVERVQGAEPAASESVDRLRRIYPMLLPSAPPAPVPWTEIFRQKAVRPRVLVPAIGGGALLLSGGISWGLARRELSKVRGEDLSDGTMDDSKRAAVRGKRYQDWGFGLAGTGVVTLGVATVLYVLQVPKAPVSPNLDATGTSALLQGTWP